MGPQTLALVDKIEAFSRGITAKEYQPRHTTKVKLLIAACIGNAELIAYALDKDMTRENNQLCWVVMHRVGTYAARHRLES